MQSYFPATCEDITSYHVASHSTTNEYVCVFSENECTDISVFTSKEWTALLAISKRFEYETD